MRSLMFWKRKPNNPARELALIGVEKRKADRRAKVRAVADEMRRELGLPAIDWSKL